MIETYGKDAKTYQEAMNATRSEKFQTIKPYLFDGATVLDFGSGFAPDFAKEIEETGSKYMAHDISVAVQNQLEDANISVLNNDDLILGRYSFDVIFMSSVFHELLSYQSRREITATISRLVKNLKPGGQIVIRDWNHENNNDIVKITTKTDVAETYAEKLQHNSIIEGFDVKENTITAKAKDMYEILLHTTWGLKSLWRESEEKYSIAEADIKKWFINPGHDLSVVKMTNYQDESYFTYLDQHFDTKNIKEQMTLYTKQVVVLEKGNK